MGGKMPRESKTSPRRVRGFERNVTALEYRKAGFTYAQIAGALGYRGRQSAHYAVERGLRYVVRECGEEAVTLELLRLDALFCGPYRAALTGDLPSLSACLAIMAVKARLLGLDSATARAVHASLFFNHEGDDNA
jgi:hypothetical protein